MTIVCSIQKRVCLIFNQQTKMIEHVLNRLHLCSLVHRKCTMYKITHFFVTMFYDLGATFPVNLSLLLYVFAILHSFTMCVIANVTLTQDIPKNLSSTQTDSCFNQKRAIFDFVDRRNDLFRTVNCTQIANEFLNYHHTLDWLWFKRYP